MDTVIFIGTDGVKLHAIDRGEGLRLVITEVDQTIIARFSQEDVTELLSSGSVENSILYTLQHSYSVNKTVLLKEECKILFFYGDTSRELQLWESEWERLIDHLSGGKAA